jgi:hypothetical protein
VLCSYRPKSKLYLECRQEIKEKIWNVAFDFVWVKVTATTTATATAIIEDHLIPIPEMMLYLHQLMSKKYKLDNSSMLLQVGSSSSSFRMPDQGDAPTMKKSGKCGRVEDEVIRKGIERQ